MADWFVPHDVTVSPLPPSFKTILFSSVSIVVSTAAVHPSEIAASNWRSVKCYVNARQITCERDITRNSNWFEEFIISINCTASDARNSNNYWTIKITVILIILQQLVENKQLLFIIFTSIYVFSSIMYVGGWVLEDVTTLNQQQRLSTSYFRVHNF